MQSKSVRAEYAKRMPRRVDDAEEARAGTPISRLLGRVGDITDRASEKNINLSEKETFTNSAELG